MFFSQDDRSVSHSYETRDKTVVLCIDGEKSIQD
jgi:hypothetical protein